MHGSKLHTTYLCPNFQHILECHTGIRQLALQQHDDIVIVLLQLHPLSGLGALSFAFLDICLKLCNLLVDVGNVLLDDVGEFLGGRQALGGDRDDRRNIESVR